MDRIIEIIAIGILDYTKILSQDPKETFIPSTRNDAVKKYNNDPIFNKTVDSIARALTMDGKVIKKSCPLYVDYKKSCKALKEREEELKSNQANALEPSHKDAQAK